MQHPHQKTLLAHSTLGQVEQCRCGIVSVTVGAVTLRLETAAYSSLVKLLQVGAAGLAEAAARQRDDMALLLGEPLGAGDSHGPIH